MVADESVRMKDSMTHECHWPGCGKSVPPKMWGCREHWYSLPKPLRDRIWATYRPGQEVDKNPSEEYVEAALAARRFALYTDGKLTEDLG